ncbi:MAG: hypothetical protein IT428_00125 [Planctomycetaceae bacterium]|nr:hypothetical protein [Planctomycetaceae bacterium]
MKNEVKKAAYNLLNTLTPDEVEELVEVLTYFNRKCQEDHRAECLNSGCAKKKGEELSPREKVLTEKTAGSSQIYLSGSNSVCPCCKR